MHQKWNERRRIMHHLRDHVHSEFIMYHVPRIMMRSHMRLHVFPQLQNVITMKNLDQKQIRTMIHFSECCIPMISSTAENLKKRRQNRLYVEALHDHVVHGLECILIMWWCTVILLSIVHKKIQSLHHEEKILVYHYNVKKQTRRNLKKYWRMQQYQPKKTLKPHYTNL